MTVREDTTQIFIDLAKSIGNLDGKVDSVLKNQDRFESRMDSIEGRLDNLYQLHSTCAGPGLADDVDELRDEVRHKRHKDSDDKISRPPAAHGGTLITWDDWKVVLKSLPLIVGIIGTVLGFQYCQSDPQNIKALVPQKAQVMQHGDEAEENKKD